MEGEGLSRTEYQGNSKKEKLKSSQGYPKRISCNQMAVLKSTNFSKSFFFFKHKKKWLSEKLKYGLEKIKVCYRWHVRNGYWTNILDQLPLSFLKESNMNKCESIEDLFEVFTFKCLLTSLSDIRRLVINNIERV